MMTTQLVRIFPTLDLNCEKDKRGVFFFMNAGNASLYISIHLFG
jgi:hypothetical protein